MVQQQRQNNRKLTHMTLKRIHLGNSGLQYIASILASGPTLMRELLNQVDLNSGSVYTLLPENINLDEASQFKIGGKIPVTPDSDPPYFFENEGTRRVATPVVNLTGELCQFIASAILNSNCTCVIEDFLALKRDFDLQNISTSETLFYEQEVYYKIGRSKKIKNQVESIIKRSWRVPHSAGILTSINKDIFNQQNLNLKSLQAIAAETFTIFVGAYDGEGFIVWEVNR